MYPKFNLRIKSFGLLVVRKNEHMSTSSNTRCIACGSLRVPRACTKWTRDEYPWRSIMKEACIVGSLREQAVTGDGDTFKPGCKANSQVGCVRPQQAVRLEQVHYQNEGHSLLWATWATLIARPCKLSGLGGPHWPILEMGGPLDCKALQIKGWAYQQAGFRTTNNQCGVQPRAESGNKRKCE